MKKSIAYTTALLFAVATPCLVAQDKETTTEKKPAKTAGKDAKKDEKKADVEIVIEGNDTMMFDKTAFSVKEGQTVKLVFKNVGKQPKAVMGHNVVILKTGTDLVKFATVAMTATTNEYIPTAKAAKDKIIAHTKLIGPGETDTITFTAPAAGTYDYLCTFPGHFALMKGKMTVEKKGAAKKSDDKKPAEKEKAAK